MARVLIVEDDLRLIRIWRRVFGKTGLRCQREVVAAASRPH